MEQPGLQELADTIRLLTLPEEERSLLLLQRAEDLLWEHRLRLLPQPQRS